MNASTDSVTSPASPSTHDSLDRRTVGGVEFEAVRCDRPRPHWRVRVVLTGFLHDAGCFKGGGSRLALWASVERTAKACGTNWVRDCLTAFDASERENPGPFVLWGIRAAASVEAPTELGLYNREAEFLKTRAGWICSAYREGEKPSGLIALSKILATAA